MTDDPERDEAICQKARAALVRDAIRWTEWCAGQGICAVKSEGITDPDDLLMEYTATTGDEEWGTLPDRVSSLEATLRTELAEQARLNGMGSEREARLMAERDEARREAGRAYRQGIEDAAKVAEKAGEPYALHTQTSAMMFRACTEKIAAAIRSLSADRRAAREASKAEEGR